MSMPNKFKIITFLKFRSPQVKVDSSLYYAILHEAQCQFCTSIRLQLKISSFIYQIILYIMQDLFLVELRTILHLP